MKTLQFTNNRANVSRGYQLPDGRIIVIDNGGKMMMNFATPFNLETGEVGETPAYTPSVKDLPAIPQGFTTLNNLIKNGIGKEVFPYNEYDIDLGRVHLEKHQIEKICKEFRENGFEVTEEAILHNYAAWCGDLKSGYRDEKNGYHLFSPCGCNPFSLRATTLEPICSDWQTTYMC